MFTPFYFHFQEDILLAEFDSYLNFWYAFLNKKAFLLESPMTQTNLILKRKKLEQRKNRLKQMEASLSVQERKNRTRRLITLGGLVSKAHLENWNANALLGGLLFLKERENDPDQMQDWIHKGGVAFSKEKEKTGGQKNR